MYETGAKGGSSPVWHLKKSLASFLLQSHSFVHLFIFQINAVLNKKKKTDWYTDAIIVTLIIRYNQRIWKHRESAGFQDRF